MRRLMIALVSSMFFSSPSSAQDVQTYFTNHIRTLLAGHYEYKMISRGQNRPSVDLESEHLGDICVLLHHRIPTHYIRSYFGWSEQESPDRLAILSREELIRSDSANAVVPTFPVVTVGDAIRHFHVPREMVMESSELIAGRLPGIKEVYSGSTAYLRVR